MKQIQKSFFIKSSREEIFNAMTNPLSLELWTGYPAVMEPKPGTEFSLWEGDITGKNLEIVHGEKIVQEWFFNDPMNSSIVTIELEDEKNGTRIHLLHTNIPDAAFNNINYGWKEYFFGALKKYIEG
jgi:activator of HSP90 ATPase